LKSLLPLESVSHDKAEDATENRMEYLMQELLQGVDPLTGWPLQPEIRRLNSFQGCTKGKYTPLMKRQRTNGEKIEPEH
jgi:hypothetical protein